MAEQKADVHVVDFTILAPPRTTPHGFKIVATFTLLARPMRIKNCSIVIAPNGRQLVWTPHESIKIAGWARDEIAETARQGFIEAQKRVAV